MILSSRATVTALQGRPPWDEPQNRANIVSRRGRNKSKVNGAPTDRLIGVLQSFSYFLEA